MPLKISEAIFSTRVQLALCFCVLGSQAYHKLCRPPKVKLNWAIDQHSSVVRRTPDCLPLDNLRLTGKHFLLDTPRFNESSIFGRISHSFLDMELLISWWLKKWDNSSPCIRAINQSHVIYPQIFWFRDYDLWDTCLRPKNPSLWYRGIKAFSVTKRPCKRWDEISHKFSDRNFGGTIFEAHNFCRNPDKSPCGPWCYVEDLSSGKKIEREPCFKSCNPERNSNSFVPCISAERWLNLRGGEKVQFDEPFGTDYISKDQKCSIGLVKNEGPPDPFNMPHQPFGTEWYPISGRATSRCPWSYTCSSESQEGEKVSWPTRVVCEDLRLTCLNVEDEISAMCHNYQGRRNFTVSGRPCMPWSILRQSVFDRKSLGFTLTSEQKSIIKDSFENCKLPDFDENNFCTNLIYFLNFDEYSEDHMDHRIGPMCFVKSGGKVEAEPCFLPCSTEITDKLGCIKNSSEPMTFYVGKKNTSTDGTPCLDWPAPQVKLHKNFCRMFFQSTVPRCFITSSRGIRKLADCFSNCDSSVAEKNFTEDWAYNPCSDPAFKSCCSIESHIQLSTSTPLTTKKKLTAVSFARTGRPITTTEDPKMKIGTLSEPGLRTTEIFQIILLIVYLLCFGCLTFCFYNLPMP